MKKVTVIGGVNADICGQSTEKLVMRDSNPGVISIRPGGVGRNIAHDLVLLGMDVSLVTALGGDALAQIIKASCTEIGIGLSMARTVKDARSSTYLYIADYDGDMCAAVNDMEIVRSITPLYLAAHMQEINRSDAVVIDANLSAEAIEYITKHCTRPIYADPVSAKKAMKLVPFLSRFEAIKPNLMEAEIMTGETGAVDCARAFVRLGVKRVFISLGADGMLGAEGDELVILPAVKTEVVNTNGAGDAATAAVTAAGMLALGLAETVEAAQRAGAITAASCYANSPELSRKTVFDGIL